MFWTKEEKEKLWQQNQARFAGIAHDYPCCDIPTITQCFACSHKPEQCKNKTEVIKALDG